MSIEESAYYIIWTFNAIYNILILRKCLKKRWIHYKSDPNKVPLFQSKSLSIFSLLTLIFSVLWPIINILQRVDYICQYATQLTFVISASAICSFNFYQYSRLYYCFSFNKTNSKQGYSNYVFYILYAMSGSLHVWSSASIWFFIKSEQNIQDPSNTSSCKITFNENYIYEVIISTVLYYIETATVLSLYVYQIMHFQGISKDKLSDEDSQKISNRIKFILNKIFALTLTAEFSMTLFTLITAITQYFNSPIYLIIIQKISSSIASIFISTSMYLMIEHNKNEYFAFIKYMDKIKICCCFKGFIQNAIDHDGMIPGRPVLKTRHSPPVVKDVAEALDCLSNPEPNNEASTHTTLAISDIARIENARESTITPTNV